MSDFNPETLSAEELRRVLPKLLAERDRFRAKNAELTAAFEQSAARVALLKEAACRALEYISSPNPYVEPGHQRQQAILYLEDALIMNGYEVARFEVRSDAN